MEISLELEKAKAQGLCAPFYRDKRNLWVTFGTNNTNENNLYTINTASTGLILIEGDYSSSRFPRYNNSNTSTPVSNMTSGYNAVYSYGNYYTWPAAIASTVNYQNSGSTVDTTLIYPSGWHIPTSIENTGEFTHLNIVLGGSNANSWNPSEAVAMSRIFR